jgi:hypothetical protein
LSGHRQNPYQLQKSPEKPVFLGLGRRFRHLRAPRNAERLAFCEAIRDAAATDRRKSAENPENPRFGMPKGTGTGLAAWVA